jgi:hypothetical protein
MGEHIADCSFLSQIFSFANDVPRLNGSARDLLRYQLVENVLVAFSTSPSAEFCAARLAK